MVSPINVFRRTRAEQHSVVERAGSILTEAATRRRQLAERLGLVEARTLTAERRAPHARQTAGGEPT